MAPPVSLVRPRKPLLKRPIFWIAIALLIVLGVAGLRLAAKKKASAAQSAAVLAPATLELSAADLGTVEKRDLRQLVRANGSLRAVNQTVVKAKVAGEVTAVLVREGEAVKAGQVVARIDPTEYEWRVKQARANVMASQGQLDIAKRARDNNVALLEKGFISSTAFQNTEGQFATAEATVEANRAALELAGKSLADSQVRAPITGTVAARMVEPGEKVSVDTSLLELVDLSTLELEAAIPAADIPRVQIGQEVAVTLEGLDAPLAGKVTRINPSNQSGSRSYLVYASIAQAPGAVRLRSGLFASVAITVARKPAVLAIPANAIRRDGSGRFVYVFEGSGPTGNLNPRVVQTGFQSDEADGAIEVVSGLAQGERFVRIDLGSLNPGPAKIAGSAGVGNSATPAPVGSGTP